MPRIVLAVKGLSPSLEYDNVLVVGWLLRYSFTLSLNCHKVTSLSQLASASLLSSHWTRKSVLRFYPPMCNIRSLGLYHSTPWSHLYKTSLQLRLWQRSQCLVSYQIIHGDHPELAWVLSISYLQYWINYATHCLYSGVQGLYLATLSTGDYIHCSDG